MVGLIVKSVAGAGDQRINLIGDTIGCLYCDATVCVIMLRWFDGLIL